MRHQRISQPEKHSSAQEVLDTFDDLLGIACAGGNWNYDPYLHGMANGMILMRSVLSGEDPVYLEAPEEWLKDRPTSGPALEYQAGFRKVQALLATTRHQAIAPRKQDLQKTYYHGTSSEAAVKHIIRTSWRGNPYL